MKTSQTRDLSQEQQKTLLGIVKSRFERNRERHQEILWEKVYARLEAHPEKLWSLYEMEKTGGEPDVVGLDKHTGEFVFFDCSAESPVGRRSICYDREGQTSRKEAQPENNAVDMASGMGIELLDEAQYRHLHTVGKFDKKSSSWIKTPSDIRKQGGALFGDYRYGQVFIYHNGAQSYYAARGFRGALKI